MKYTVSETGDKKIESDMKIICKEILDRVKGVRSMILTGGFSRGEGAIKIEGDKIFPYNDYDIQIIGDNPINKKEIDKISIEVSEKLGYKGIINFYPFKKENQKMKNNFYVDLKADSFKNLKKMLPRIRTYELKNNSMILYGEDLRNLIPNYKIEEIPLSEGAKLLLDRMSQMIEYYSMEKKHDEEFLMYIIQQAYAACCTALLLLSKKYQIGYKKSMEILKETYKVDFPTLYERIPNLSEKIEQFNTWKLNPKKILDLDAKEEWFIAKENILEVSKYFLSAFLKKKIETLDGLSNAISRMKKEFYTPYLKEMIKKKIGIGKRFSFLILPFVLKILKKKYNRRLGELGVDFKTKKLCPDLSIFSSLIYIIGSINSENIDENMLGKAKIILSKVYPINGTNWEEISTDYANAYIAFFLQKI
jgi:hypothetical protein